MKKLLIIALVFVLGTNLGIAKEKVAGPTLDFQLRFGKKSMDCLGFGFCKFTIFLSKTIDNNTVNAMVTFNEKSKYLEIKINKETGILDETAEIYFANNSFKVDEDFELSDEVLTALNIENNFVIRKGIYKVIDLGDYYQLIIK